MDSTAISGQEDTGTVRVNPAIVAAVATLVVVSLAMTLVARMTGYDASALPDSQIVEARQLGFRDEPNGVVEVYDWDSGVVLRSIASGEGSFLRGVVRSLVRQRRGLNDGVSTAFTLSRHADGRLVLADQETGESIDLVAFGPDNYQVFATLLPSQTHDAAQGTAQSITPAGGSH